MDGRAWVLCHDVRRGNEALGWRAVLAVLCWTAGLQQRTGVGRAVATAMRLIAKSAGFASPVRV